MADSGLSPGTLRQFQGQLLACQARIARLTAELLREQAIARGLRRRLSDLSLDVGLQRQRDACDDDE